MFLTLLPLVADHFWKHCFQHFTLIITLFIEFPCFYLDIFNNNESTVCNRRLLKKYCDTRLVFKISNFYFWPMLLTLFNNWNLFISVFLIFAQLFFKSSVAVFFLTGKDLMHLIRTDPDHPVHPHSCIWICTVYQLSYWRFFKRLLNIYIFESFS